ncbi:unnamed protein product [Caretta caretta]
MLVASEVADPVSISIVKSTPIRRSKLLIQTQQQLLCQSFLLLTGFIEVARADSKNSRGKVKVNNMKNIPTVDQGAQ